MGEMSEYWKDIKEFQQEKRWSNYDYNKKALEENQVKFQEKSNGHFIILNSNNKAVFDFWATTGLFISRETKKKSRGIKNLLRFVKQSR